MASASDYFINNFQIRLHIQHLCILFLLDWCQVKIRVKILYFVPVCYYIMHRKERSFKLCFGVLRRFLDDGCVRDGSLGEVPFMNGIECLEYLLQPWR